MTPHEQNGRIKMTWGQVVWAVSMFLMLAGMWSRMEVRMALIENKLEGKANVADVDHCRTLINAHLGIAPPAEASTTMRREP